MPPSAQPLANSSTAASYFPYPVRNAVTSAFRRFSSSSRSSSKTRTASAPAMPLAQGRSLNADGSSDRNKYDYNPDSDDDFQPLPPPPVFTSSHVNLGRASPVPRPSPTPPPFHAPPLTPLSLVGLDSAVQILSRLLAEEIRLLVPPRVQLVDTWHLLFNLEADGASLATLYDRCGDYRGRRGGFVVVVRDGAGSTFGAYLSDAPAPSQGHYYGTGECFLWRSSILSGLPTLASLPPLPSGDTTHAVRTTTLGSPESLGSTAENGTGTNGAATPDRMRFKAFPYSGINDYTIFCEHGFLSVGGGDGHYGLWLDSALERGVTASCPTFGNEPLSEEAESRDRDARRGAATGKFDVLGVEVWFVGA